MRWHRPAIAVVVAGGVVLSAAGAAAHLWYAPFVVGLALGWLTALRRTRARVTVLCTVGAAAGGWGIPLLWRAAAGEPVVAAARTAAAVAGLPAAGEPLIAATLLVAVLQGLVGAWLARSTVGLGTPLRRIE